MNLGEKILTYRKKLGLSQEQLGEKVGVSRQTISKWEIGQTIPELEKMILLAKEFQTTIDELVKDDDEMVLNEESKQENNSNNVDSFIKLMYGILIIIITIIGIYVGIILYRFLMFNAFGKAFSKAGIEKIDEQGIGWPVENYRVSEYKWNNQNNMITTTDEVTYYRLGNVYKKEYGNYIDPVRIEYLNYDTKEYYDIDCKNKTYIKTEIPNIETQVELTEKTYLLSNEILANFNVRSKHGCFELARNFDYNIRIINGQYYIDNYKYYEDFVSSGVSKWCVSFTKEKYEEKTQSVTSNFVIDYGVVNEHLIRLPDLTDYTQK